MNTWPARLWLGIKPINTSAKRFPEKSVELAPSLKKEIYPKMSFAYKRPMKKYICMIVTVGLLAACEKRTETVTPGASPTPSSETTTTAESPATEPGTTTSSPSP
jgi:hypothetical protein